MSRVLAVYTNLPTVCNGICYSIKFHWPARYALLLKRWEHKCVVKAIRIIKTRSSITTKLKNIPNAICMRLKWNMHHDQLREIVKSNQIYISVHTVCDGICSNSTRRRSCMHATIGYNFTISKLEISTIQDVDID